ncbi:MAG TPA: hypothetical protein VHT97_03700 [Acidimicrobiales bacterium]|nr:hypothetical protein [Acidimicrobiales bacterium]
MSTFLVSLGVVAATIAAVVRLALSGPDQPATIRRQPSRARRDRKRAAAAQRAAARAAQAATRADLRAVPEPAQAERPAARDLAPAQPVVAATGTTAAAAVIGVTAPQPVVPVGVAHGSPAAALPDSDPMRLRVLPAKPTTIWVRMRSAVALVVLVAVLGALLAMVVGAILVGAAFLIRSATG